MNETQKNGAESTKEPVYYNYKDRIFRMLFKDKKRLLELYNALNDTEYTNEKDLMVNTLENAIFLKMKNDVSFIIDSNMCLYEHQSSYCPNMPLRGFFYFADLYKKWCGGVDLSIRKQIMIPAPHYVVFYNGLEKQEEEFVQRLSQSFENGQEGCIELTVRTININYGHNIKLLSKCKTLSDYAYFIAEIRNNLNYMVLEEAVAEAIEHCIKNNILKEFLTEQKSEVIAMSIYEYNEEYVRKSLLEEGQEIGYAEGIEKGKAEGKAELLVSGVENIMQKLSMDVERACDIIGIEIEEYEQAKKFFSKK